MYGFAVDPDDANHVVAAGPDGLLTSTDGGLHLSRYRPHARGAELGSSRRAPGVDVGGAVYHDGPSAGLAAARCPANPRLLATTDMLFAVAAHDTAGLTGIYRSTDDGATWHLRYQTQHRDPK